MSGDHGGGGKVTGFEKLAKIPRFGPSGAGGAVFSARSSGKISRGDGGGGDIASRIATVRALRGGAEGVTGRLAGDLGQGNEQKAAVGSDVNELKGSVNSLNGVVGQLTGLVSENAQWIVECANELAKAIAQCNVEGQKEHKQMLQNKITAQGIIEGKLGEAQRTLSSEQEGLANSEGQSTEANSGVPIIQSDLGQAGSVVASYDAEITLLDSQAAGGSKEGTTGQQDQGNENTGIGSTFSGNLRESVAQTNRVNQMHEKEAKGSVGISGAAAISYAQGVLARTMV